MGPPPAMTGAGARAAIEPVIPSARIFDTSAPTVPPVMASAGRSRQTMKGPYQRVKTYAAWYNRPSANWWGHQGVGPSTFGGWTAPTALPRSSQPSAGVSPPAARPPAPRRHGPSQTGHIPAPAVADRRAQSWVLSRGGQGGETKSDFWAHPAGDCPRLRFCQLGAIDL